MKNNPNAQANPDKSGSKTSQKSTELDHKKGGGGNTQAAKKDKQNKDVVDPEEMEEGTTLNESSEEQTDEKPETKTGKQRK